MKTLELKHKFTHFITRVGNLWPTHLIWPAKQNHLVHEMLISYLLFFISIFSLLTCKKAMEVLIHRVSNYTNLLLEIPRYCCLLEIFLIEIILKFRTASQNHQAGKSAVKCLSQGHNRMV